MDTEARRDPGDERRREEARDLLRGELREAVGDEAARRAERKGALDAAIDVRPKTVVGVLSESRALVAITFFVALIVGAVAALITGSWLFVVVALLLHAVGTAVVVGTTLAMTSQVEHPDPRTVAALEERGVRNPDAALNEAVAVAAEDAEEGSAAARIRDEQTGVSGQRGSRRPR